MAQISLSPDFNAIVEAQVGRILDPTIVAATQQMLSEAALIAAGVLDETTGMVDTEALQNYMHSSMEQDQLAAFAFQDAGGVHASDMVLRMQDQLAHSLCDNIIGAANAQVGGIGPVASAMHEWFNENSTQGFNPETDDINGVRGSIYNRIISFDVEGSNPLEEIGKWANKSWCDTNSMRSYQCETANTILRIGDETARQTALEYLNDPANAEFTQAYITDLENIIRADMANGERFSETLNDMMENMTGAERARFTAALEAANPNSVVLEQAYQLGYMHNINAQALDLLSTGVLSGDLRTLEALVNDETGELEIVTDTLHDGMVNLLADIELSNGMAAPTLGTLSEDAGVMAYYRVERTAELMNDTEVEAMMAQLIGRPEERLALLNNAAFMDGLTSVDALRTDAFGGNFNHDRRDEILAANYQVTLLETARQLELDTLNVETQDSVVASINALVAGGELPPAVAESLALYDTYGIEPVPANPQDDLLGLYVTHLLHESQENPTVGLGALFAEMNAAQRDAFMADETAREALERQGMLDEAQQVYLREHAAAWSITMLDAIGQDNDTTIDSVLDFMSGEDALPDGLVLPDGLILSNEEIRDVYLQTLVQDLSNPVNFEELREEAQVLMDNAANPSERQAVVDELTQVYALLAQENPEHADRYNAAAENFQNTHTELVADAYAISVMAELNTDLDDKTVAFLESGELDPAIDTYGVTDETSFQESFQAHLNDNIDLQIQVAAVAGGMPPWLAEMEGLDAPVMEATARLAEAGMTADQVMALNAQDGADLTVLGSAENTAATAWLADTDGGQTLLAGILASGNTAALLGEVNALIDTHATETLLTTIAARENANELLGAVIWLQAQENGADRLAAIMATNDPIESLEALEILQNSALITDTHIAFLLSEEGQGVLLNLDDENLNRTMINAVELLEDISTVDGDDAAEIQGERIDTALAAMVADPALAAAVFDLQPGDADLFISNMTDQEIVDLFSLLPESETREVDLRQYLSEEQLVSVDERIQAAAQAAAVIDARIVELGEDVPPSLEDEMALIAARNNMLADVDGVVINEDDVAIEVAVSSNNIAPDMNELQEFEQDAIARNAIMDDAEISNMPEGDRQALEQSTAIEVIGMTPLEEDGTLPDGVNPISFVTYTRDEEEREELAAVYTQAAAGLQREAEAEVEVVQADIAASRDDAEIARLRDREAVVIEHAEELEVVADVVPAEITAASIAASDSILVNNALAVVNNGELLEEALPEHLQDDFVAGLDFGMVETIGEELEDTLEVNPWLEESLQNNVVFDDLDLAQLEEGEEITGIEAAQEAAMEQVYGRADDLVNGVFAGTLTGPEVAALIEGNPALVGDIANTLSPEQVAPFLNNLDTGTVLLLTAPTADGETPFFDGLGEKGQQAMMAWLYAPTDVYTSLPMLERNNDLERTELGGEGRPGEYAYDLGVDEFGAPNSIYDVLVDRTLALNGVMGPDQDVIEDLATRQDAIAAMAACVGGQCPALHLQDSVFATLQELVDNPALSEEARAHYQQWLDSGELPQDFAPYHEDIVLNTQSLIMFPNGGPTFPPEFVLEMAARNPEALATRMDADGYYAAEIAGHMSPEQLAQLMTSLNENGQSEAVSALLENPLFARQVAEQINETIAINPWDDGLQDMTRVFNRALTAEQQLILLDADTGNGFLSNLSEESLHHMQHLYAGQTGQIIGWDGLSAEQQQGLREAVAEAKTEQQENRQDFKDALWDNNTEVNGNIDYGEDAEYVQTQIQQLIENNPGLLADLNAALGEGNSFVVGDGISAAEEAALWSEVDGMADLNFSYSEVEPEDSITPSTGGDGVGNPSTGPNIP